MQRSANVQRLSPESFPPRLSKRSLRCCIYIFQQQLQLRLLLLLLLLLTVCPKRPHHALFPFLPHLCARANSLPPLPSLPSYPTLSQLRLPAPISVPPSPHPTKFFTASRTVQHLSCHLPMFPHLIFHLPPHQFMSTNTQYLEHAYRSPDWDTNVSKAESIVRAAAAKGANIILLQELFQTWYFCQVRNGVIFSQ